MPKTPVQKKTLYKKVPSHMYEIVQGMLSKVERPLTDDEKRRLKSEALTFKSTLLYRLLAEETANEMQREIVDNATPENLHYFRAVLADRRILIQEIDRCAKLEVDLVKLDRKEKHNI